MHTHIEAIKWLLYESDISTSNIAQKCQLSCKLITDLRQDEGTVLDLKLSDAERLSDYAHEVKEAQYYSKRRWIVLEDNQLKIYRYENLRYLSEDAKLISETYATPEVEAFEKMIAICEQMGDAGISRNFIVQRCKQAERKALYSLGFQ